MTDRDIQSAINELRRQLNEAVGKRDLLNVKILTLEQNIRNLRDALIGTRLTALRGENESEESFVGLTEAIRVVLRRNSEPMTSSEVRMSLRAMGFDLKRFANPSGTVTNTLKRMAESGELEEKGKKYWFHRYADLYRAGIRGDEEPR
jgi:hypothetical protein